MSADENTIVVTYVGKELQVPPKTSSVLGEYKRTEPFCFRKELNGKQVGGKLEFKDGYWYLADKVGTKVAWAEGGKTKVPTEKWQASGEGFFKSSEDAHISVKPKASTMAALASKEIGCSEFCSTKFHEVKAKLPAHHREKVENIHAKANQHIDKVREKANEHLPVIKEKAGQHMEFAKAKYNEHAPVVKQKTKEGYNACYEWWTHPDTVTAMKKGAETATEALKHCAAGCLSLCAAGLDMIAGHKQHESESAQVPGALQDDEGFVKLEPTVVPM